MKHNNNHNYAAKPKLCNIFLVLFMSHHISIYCCQAENLIYTMKDRFSNEDMVFDITDRCQEFFGIGDPETLDPTSRDYCILFEPVLQPFIDQGGHGLHMAMDGGQNGGNPHAMCSQQLEICEATEKFQGYDKDCKKVLSRCRSALRHLHKMMFVDPADGEQICNNFARKSIRGFFHDYMSKGIEGSILDEHDVSMNFGLCRWSQYINVLSDHTKCDPGSIIAMAGELGYLACGVDLFDLDIDVKPLVTVNRPYPCGSNIDDSPLFDSSTKQRKEQFSDRQLSTNSTAMEEFWYSANEHSFGRPDGEIEYSGEAAGAAHAVGRVTCPPDGVTNTGKHQNYKLGFFQKPRENLKDEYPNIWWAVNTTDVNRQYQNAIDKLADTQCAEDESGNDKPQPEGIRPSTNEFPLKNGDTDFNAEGGLCGMPTQFLGTVRMGGLNRVPRWVELTQHSAPDWPEFSQYQSSCREDITMSIQKELLTLSNRKLPSSSALDKFLTIAWDGYDRIDSEWDSCSSGCEIPIAGNRLCGGAGLHNFDWEKCQEDLSSRFVKFLKEDDNGVVQKVVKKTCGWLSNKSNPNVHCKRYLSHKHSALNTCPITCKVCVPSKCEENPKSKFVRILKKASDGSLETLVLKSCGWLAKRTNSKKICEKKNSYKEYGSAVDTCLITCGICTPSS
mmetsp:Transcript_7127/g.10213  ORF Transcript_7127/g.10213 Transcript_7127/m.10213 type:complete len:673 (-) Transcript_7127:143-2161(-)